MVPNDIERAAALLAMHYKLVPPARTVELIAQARTAANPQTALAAALMRELGENQLLSTIGTELGYGFVDLHAPGTEWSVDEAAAVAVGVEALTRHSALPLRDHAGNRAVAVYHPAAQSDVVDWMRSHLGGKITVLLSPKRQIDSKLVYFDTAGFAEADAPAPAEEVQVAAVTTSVVNNPVVDFVDNLLARAVAEGASDVHFLTLADESLLIRFRVDGTMRRQAYSLRRREREIVGTVLAKCGDNIDASDRTRPQDGTFSFVAPGGRRIDARLGMLPQAYGPTVVVRLLDPENINRRLEDMGFATATLEQMRRVVRTTQGSALFIGPTGSGKTTTLYSILKELPALDLVIMTAEDPIEYRLPHIGQTQIRSDLGEKSLTFSKALRAMMRLNPDVMLIGEIRDQDTAETTMQAALTGHMVLSTLHAKTAPAVYSRLAELGVEPSLAAEALSLVVNQRLVRTVHTCANIEAPTEREIDILTRLHLPIPDKVAHPRPGGCPGCNGTGMRGRVAAAEIMEPSDELKELVAVAAGRHEIIKAATTQGYTPILTDAFRHVADQRIPVRELLRVAGAGEL